MCNNLKLWDTSYLMCTDMGIGLCYKESIQGINQIASKTNQIMYQLHILFEKKISSSFNPNKILHFE